MSRYNLRSAQNSSSQSDSEEENLLNITIMEGATQPGTQPIITTDQMSNLIASLNALKTSIGELQKSSADNQRELESLRRQIPCREVNVAQQRTDAVLTPSTEPEANAIVPAQHEPISKIYDLPVFSGGAEEWPLFHANFRDTTEAFKYSNRQNLMRLQKCLVGPAKETVASMLIHPENVPNILKELKFRFGRPELLIRVQLAKVQQFPMISEQRLDQVVEFSTKVRNIVSFLATTNSQQHLANPVLLEQLVSKLPQSNQFEWARRAAEISPYPTINDFSIWLSELARIVCLMPPSGIVTSKGNLQPKRIMHVEENTPNRSRKCNECGANHLVADCEIFCQTLAIEDRWKKVKSQHLCFSCLRQGHRAAYCRYKRVCGINGCQRYHHKCLHEDRTKLPAPVSDSVNKILNCSAPHTTCSQIFKILPVMLYGPKGKTEVFAMIDEGSAISILEEDVATSLGLKGQLEPLTLQWYGEKVTTESSSKVSLEISGNESSQRFAIKNIRTIKNLNLPMQSFKRSLFSHFEFLPLADYTNVKPVMLLGLDNVHLGVSSTVVEADQRSPVAARTKLGWVAYGPTQNSNLKSSIMLHIREDYSMQQLNRMISEYFEADNFGVNPLPGTLEPENEKAARLIMESTTKLVGNRYETGLLWKEFPPNLPCSFEMAKSRLLGIEKRMCRDPEFGEKYCQEMDKYFNKNYARKISDEELQNLSQPTWYLPHFGVQSVQKPGKLRIVFDAAAAIAGTSLNSKLLKGPEQAKPLLSILFKFRQGKVAVAADIREMFSQVNIRPADQQAQRFLWRNGDPNQPIQHYAMSTMIFGAVCSPCCAEFIKNHNANKFKEQFPAAVDAIINKHYVDDFVASFENINEAERVCKEVVEIHANAGFELRGFVSNSDVLQKTMNGDLKKLVNVISMEKQASAEKVLGMYWNTPDDTFKFETKFQRISQQVLQGIRPPTKRELLGIVMAIFDPYGLLANFLIFSKVLVQETWKHNISWDDIIPAELHKRWNSWWSEFQNVQNFKIQRCYSSNFENCGNIELHIFVDASETAFAAVGYFRVDHAGKIDVAFVAGKTRTAPRKLMSIPRLELQAAVLGVRLGKLIMRFHDKHLTRVIFWSDSQIVLHWITSVNRKFKPFVGHRIAEILRSSEAQQWRWTPTSENAADAATRYKFPPKFEINNSIWIAGPSFLKQSEEFWPAFNFEQLPLLEEEVQPCHLLKQQASNVVIKISNFSSYLKLKRSMAWVLRFCKLLLHSRDANWPVSKGPLTNIEIDNAEVQICKMVQEECFAEEISALRGCRPINKQSSLYSLSPYLAEDGLVRVQGRLDEAIYLPFAARRPILLPQKHILTTLIMRHYHEKLYHQNSAVTINEVRQKFWIPHAKAVLKTTQRDCVVCKINKAKPAPPLMGQLPADRVTPYVRPFTYTGVDLFGPFNVAVGRRREKRWGVIFTCLTVRAAHLELAENLSTDAFILCLRNFINRRGAPLRIRSDNGTNFIGVQKDLKEADCLLDVERINDEATKRGIEWKFNCPANPSSGGCWERLIKIIKSLLTKTLREVAPRVETLRSVLIEAEGIINSRPLTDIPISSAEDEPLTPNHFLIGCVNSTQTPHPVDVTICLRKQWRIAQNLKDRLWKRWTLEYLPQLLHRSKWHEKTVPLKVDDLVIICDPSQPRNQWQKGHVTKVFPAKDGQIRFVELRTPNGLLRRPVSRLATLTLDGDSRRNHGGEGVSEVTQ